MRALVTGAAGFIGSQLVESLLGSGHEVDAIDSFSDYYSASLKRANIAAALEHPQLNLVDADLNDLELEPYVVEADVVYHLAGQPGVRASWGDEFNVYLSQNVLATQRLLEAAKAAGDARVVFASSSSVYGQAERFPTREDDRPRPLSPYGVTKLAAEHLCDLYHTAFGVKTVCLRYFTIFGPRQRPDMAFNRFIAAALADRPLTIIGDGGQARDFTYVGDAVAGTIAAGEQGTPGSIYNISGGCRATVLEVVETLERLLERPLRREHLDPVPGDPRRTGADTSRARAELGFDPRVSLEEGLARQLEHAKASLASTQAGGQAS